MRKRGVSLHRQAVLIQDVLSFREYLRPFLEQIWVDRSFGQYGFEIEEAMAWIIRELIWQNTQCHIFGHERGYGYRVIYSHLQVLMDKPTLQDVFHHLIRVPNVYGDAELAVALNGRDLTIMYFIPQPLRYI